MTKPYSAGSSTRLPVCLMTCPPFSLTIYLETFQIDRKRGPWPVHTRETTGRIVVYEYCGDVCVCVCVFPAVFPSRMLTFVDLVSNIIGSYRTGVRSALVIIFVGFPGGALIFLRWCMCASF